MPGSMLRNVSSSPTPDSCRLPCGGWCRDPLKVARQRARESLSGKEPLVCNRRSRANGWPRRGVQPVARSICRHACESLIVTDGHQVKLIVGKDTRQGDESPWCGVDSLE